MTVTFVDDDPGFVCWRDAHESGFVLSHERKPRPNFLKLHRATCPSLQGGQPARGGDWTRVLAKTCSDALDDLRRWAQMSAGGEPEQCPICVNAGEAPTSAPLPQVPSSDDSAVGTITVDAQRLRVALRNELGWMLNAAVRFARRANDDMALQDSTLLHARKLVEFAAGASARKKDVGDRAERWVPASRSGERRLPSSDLARFLDDWMMHLGAPHDSDVVWPIDKTGSRIASDDPARLSKVVDLVLDFLETAAADVVDSPVGDTYPELLRRARDYWRDTGVMR
jgi:hypothetical protein